MIIELAELAKDKRIKKTIFVFYGNAVLAKLARRYVLFKAYLRHKIGFKYLFRCLITGIVNPDHYNEIMAEAILKDLYYEITDRKNSFLLFGNKFFLLEQKDRDKTSILNSFLCVLMIIFADQYHAREFIGLNDTVLDIGAHQGTFSAFAASLAKKGKVFSFEPTKSTFLILEKNFARQKNVSVLNLGVGDITCQKIIATSKIYPPSNLMTDSDSYNINLLAADQKEQKVDVISIDDFIKSKKIKKVDFIKIDAEGYEKRIIQGGKETIKKLMPVIAVSAYHCKDDKTKLIKMISQIQPLYRHRLSKLPEEDLFFYIPKHKT